MATVTTQYDGDIAAQHRVFPNVPEAVVRAVIATESGFNPNAVRGEPHIGDASYGLMQVLLSTARKLGYPDTAPAEGLLVSSVNIHYGTKLLAQNIALTGNWPDAISAYNGGYRPDIGFGRKVTRPVQIISARDAAGNPTAYKQVPVGQYANQSYVDRVLGYLRQYAPATASQILSASVLGGGATGMLWMLLFGGLAYLVYRRFGG